MNTLNLIIFWISALTVLYVYFGYPILLNVVYYFKKNNNRKVNITPFVTIIIAAFNEEKAIAKKIENTLQLDYPKSLLEIIVFSDGSTDDTNKIVESYADKDVILNVFQDQIGKTEAQNRTVKISNGQIIVFSDATTIYHADAIKMLVRNFADENVGCVGGQLHYITPESSSVGGGSGFYWRYEQYIKKLESAISSLIGVSGCMYAVRKDQYEDLEPEIISDFIVAVENVKRGKRVVYESEAICEEFEEKCLKDEFKMRRRVILRSLKGLFSRREMMNPLKYNLFSIQLISHKLLRYSICFCMISIFISNLFLLGNFFFQFFLTLQIVYYIFVFIGIIRHYLDKTNNKFIYYLFYFFFINLTALLAWIDFWRGREKNVWVPIR